MLNNKIRQTYINVDSFYKGVLLIFMCVIYGFNEIRIPFELLLFIFYSYYLFTRRKKLNLYFIWSILFAGFCCISFFWSENKGQTIIEGRVMIQWIILGNLIVGFTDKEEKIYDVLKYFIIAGYALIIRLVYTFPIETWLDGRLGDNTLGLNPNKLGLYLAISAVCSIFLKIYRGKKSYYINFILFSIIIMLTGSRKALMMLGICTIGLLYLNSHKFIKKLKAIVLIGVVLFIGYYIVMDIPVFYDIIGNRVESMMNKFDGNGDVDGSTELRLQMIESGKYYFVRKPIIGYGIGAYGVVSGYGMYSHNNYIELLVGLGLIGTTIYYSIYIYVLFMLYRAKKRKLGNCFLVIMLSLVVVEYGLVSYNEVVYQMIIALSFATIRILESKDKKSVSDCSEVKI